jgi:predicted nucleotide-binding protein
MARRSTAPEPKSVELTPEKKRWAITRLERRIAELQGFDPTAVVDRSDPRVSALEQALDETLVSIFGADTVDYNRYRYSGTTVDRAPMVMGGIGRLQLQAGLSSGRANAISTLQGIIARFNEELELASAQPKGEALANASGESRRVFVVQGHDEGAREAVARFIERIGLEPIILHERPNKGRTLITKFREEAMGAAFAAVLMTPDDRGAKAGEPTTQPRARQNVVFELGFFIGRFGPERVAALIKGNVEPPSDFEGVVYINLDDTGWKQELAKELEAAGFEVDWNKVMRKA